MDEFSPPQPPTIAAQLKRVGGVTIGWNLRTQKVTTRLWGHGLAENVTSGQKAKLKQQLKPLLKRV